MSQSPYGMANTITVNGEGKASVKPDILIINFSISELADTTEKAQTQSNEKVSKLKELFSGFNIPEKDVKTTNVNTYPEYDRSDASGRKLLGYRSQHSLSVTLSGENFGEIGGQIITKTAEIWGVNVDGSYFDLKDKNSALAEGRGKALEDARAKAEQLAKASGARLGKVVTITDNTYYSIPGPMYYAREESKGMGGVAVDQAANTQSLSPWETEVMVNVNVVYKIR